MGTGSTTKCHITGKISMFACLRVQDSYWNYVAKLTFASYSNASVRPCTDTASNVKAIKLFNCPK